MYTAPGDGGATTTDYGVATIGFTDRLTLDVTYGAGGRAKVFASLAAPPLVDLPFPSDAPPVISTTVTIGAANTYPGAPLPATYTLFDDLAIDLLP